MKTNVTSRAPSCPDLSQAETLGKATSAAKDHARLLAQIEAALARMEAGRYGLCLSCEGRIALARLEADPTEAVCETCDEFEDA